MTTGDIWQRIYKGPGGNTAVVPVKYNRAIRAMQSLRALPSNQLIAQCLSRGTPECWEEFVRRFQPVIALSMLRVARNWGVSSPARIEDLVQDMFLKLCADNCRLLRAFEPRETDSILGYLKILSANTARDVLRAQNTIKRGRGVFVSDDETVVESIAAQNGRHSSDSEWGVQLREIEEALRSLIPGTLTERDRTIFWLYFRQGFSARDISGIPDLGLTIKGVESSIHRTTRELRSLLNQKPLGDRKGFSPRLTILEEEA